MKTFIQLLRIGFWMLPMQRGMTLLGSLLVCASLLFRLPFFMPGGGLPFIFMGVAMIMVIPLAAGGAFFRMLSSRRQLALLPHFKGRMLGGMIGITLLATLVWIGAYFATFMGAPPKYRPDLESYTMMYVLTLSFATQCTIGVFVASRAPIWGLFALLAWQLPGIVLRLLNVDDVPRLLSGPVGLAMVPVTWIIFGIWYLRTRQIHRSAWISGGAATREAPLTPRLAAPLTREEGMTRWLLAGSTPVHMGVQWTLVAAALIGAQWLVYWIVGDGNNPRAAHAMMFGTLSFGAVAIGALSTSMAARARGLWLTGGRLRPELHAWCERQMLRLVLAISAAVAIVGAVLWLLTTPRPGLPGAYLLLSMLAPGLAAAWLGLMQQHRRSLLDPLAAVAIVVGWYYGLALPLFGGVTQPLWGIAAAQLALVIVLREVARARWRSADWRRTERNL